MSDEKKQKDVIDELIEKVDDPVCGWKTLSKWERFKLIGANILSLIISLIYLCILAYAICSLLPLITKPEVLLPITIALTALIFQFGIVLKELTKPIEREETIRVTTEWNYQRIKDRVKDEHQLLLKALIKMKTLHEDFKLSEVRRKYPSLFNEENLVGNMLYGLSSLPVDNSEKSL